MESWITLALPGAVAYATSLLGNRTRGEDVVQDCACRLLASAERYDLARDGRKLLFRAITNACINIHTRERESVSLDELGRISEESTWELEDKATPTPVEIVMSEELRSAIAAGLMELSLPQRSVIELSSLGYRSVEIAEMLEMPSDRVRVLLFRARQAMAEYLGARHLGGVTS